MDELASRIRGQLRGPGPHAIGIAGGVAAGKSTIATRLADMFRTDGTRTHVLPTDAFLLPNATLDERDLAMRKGFPETYDLDAMAGALESVRSGATTSVPVYSHEVYDILAGERATIEAPDLLILEGVVALQRPLALDASVYIDADEEHIKGWFLARFQALTDAARSDPSSFYARFTIMPPDALKAFATSVWDSINGPNLREHILPTRSRASIVVEKAQDHSIVVIRYGGA